MMKLCSLLNQEWEDKQVALLRVDFDSICARRRCVYMNSRVPLEREKVNVSWMPQRHTI